MHFRWSIRLTQKYLIVICSSTDARRENFWNSFASFALKFKFSFKMAVLFLEVLIIFLIVH